MQNVLLDAEVPPYSTEIWKWGLEHYGVRVLDVTPEQIILTLLPRTIGRFTRQGLKVNGLRYYNDCFTELYLCGGEVEVAHNPDDVSAVWIIEAGKYIRFELIDVRFDGMSFDAVEELKQKQRQISKDAREYSLQAEIQLARNIETVINMVRPSGEISTKGIRDNRRKEQKKQHIDYVRKVGVEDVLDYFRLADMKGLLIETDKWTRRRIRAVYWKQWKRVRTRYRILRKLKLEHWQAIKLANSRCGYWRMAEILGTVITNKIIAKLGYTSLLDHYLIVYEN